MSAEQRPGRHSGKEPEKPKKPSFKDVFGEVTEPGDPPYPQVVFNAAEGRKLLDDRIIPVERQLPDAAKGRGSRRPAVGVAEAPELPRPPRLSTQARAAQAAAEERTVERRKGLTKEQQALAAIILLLVLAVGSYEVYTHLPTHNDGNNPPRATLVATAEGQQGGTIQGTVVQEAPTALAEATGTPAVPQLDHITAALDNPAVLDLINRYKGEGVHDANRPIKELALGDQAGPVALSTDGIEDPQVLLIAQDATDGQYTIIGHATGQPGQPFMLAPDTNGNKIARIVMPEEKIRRDIADDPSARGLYTPETRFHGEQTTEGVVTTFATVVETDATGKPVTMPTLNDPDHTWQITADETLQPNARVTVITVLIGNGTQPGEKTGAVPPAENPAATPNTIRIAPDAPPVFAPEAQQTQGLEAYNQGSQLKDQAANGAVKYYTRNVAGGRFDYVVIDYKSDQVLLDVLTADNATVGSTANGDTTWTDGQHHLNTSVQMAQASTSKKPGWDLVFNGVFDYHGDEHTSPEGTQKDADEDPHGEHYNDGRAVMAMNRKTKEIKLGVLTREETKNYDLIIGAGPMEINNGKTARAGLAAETATEFPYGQGEDFPLLDWRIQMLAGLGPRSSVSLCDGKLVYTMSIGLNGEEYMRQLKDGLKCEYSIGNDDDTSTQGAWRGQNVFDDQNRPVPNNFAVYVRQ